MISGSTGQIQISADDLMTLAIPNVVVEQRNEIACMYQQRMREFVSPVTKVRKRICSTAAEISNILFDEKCLELDSDISVQWADAEFLFSKLSLLKPKMF
jgi:hypothetical protein